MGGEVWTALIDAHMQSNEPPQENYRHPDISAWAPEEVLDALMHELKRHINSIYGFAVILSPGFDQETNQQAVHSILLNAEQMKALIHDIKDYLEKRHME